MSAAVRAVQRPADGSAAAALFGGLLDDAALFPPREATPAEALRGHFAQRSGPYGIVQGSFVVPARRLREVLRLHSGLHGALRLNVIVDFADLSDGIDAVSAALAAADPSKAVVGAFEMRLPSADVPRADLARGCAALHGFVAPGASVPYAGVSHATVAEAAPDARIADAPVPVFLESARTNAAPQEAEALAAAISGLRLDIQGFVGAKLRSGGVSSDAMPASETVVRFILAMREHGIAWKATAGLHHPVRGTHAGLAMHGFLNVLAATLGAHTTALDAGQLVAVLEDGDPAAFRLSPTTFAWRDVTFDVPAIATARRDALRAIGSCSFDEPVDGLRALGMLP